MNDIVTFQNKGVIDLRGITTFGVCAKETNNPIGYFGTGLKYAIAIILREGYTITIWQGTNKHKFCVKKDTMRGKDFGFCFMDNKPLPFTTELGKNWELWQAFRELYANAKDELDSYITDDCKVKPSKGITTIEIKSEEFYKLFLNKDSIVLSSKPIYKYNKLEVHEGSGEWLYLNGVRIHKLAEHAMFNYNLLGNHSLTEDRTLVHSFLADKAIAKAIASSNDYSFIRTVLEANEKRYESIIDFHWSDITPGETFNEIITKYISSGYSYYNKSAKALHKDHNEVVDLLTKKVSTKLANKLAKACEFWKSADIIIEPITITEQLLTLWDIRKKCIYISDKLLYKSDHEINIILYLAHVKLKYINEKALPITVDKLVYLLEKQN